MPLSSISEIAIIALMNPDQLISFFDEKLKHWLQCAETAVVSLVLKDLLYLSVVRTEGSVFLMRFTNWTG